MRLAPDVSPKPGACSDMLHTIRASNIALMRRGWRLESWPSSSRPPTYGHRTCVHPLNFGTQARARTRARYCAYYRALRSLAPSNSFRPSPWIRAPKCDSTGRAVRHPPPRELAPHRVAPTKAIPARRYTTARLKLGAIACAAVEKAWLDAQLVCLQLQVQLDPGMRARRRTPACPHSRVPSRAQLRQSVEAIGQPVQYLLGRGRTAVLR